MRGAHQDMIYIYIYILEFQFCGLNTLLKRMHPRLCVNLGLCFIYIYIYIYIYIHIYIYIYVCIYIYTFLYISTPRGSGPSRTLLWEIPGPVLLRRRGQPVTVNALFYKKTNIKSNK